MVLDPSFGDSLWIDFGNSNFIDPLTAIRASDRLDYDGAANLVRLPTGKKIPLTLEPVISAYNNYRLYVYDLSIETFPMDELDSTGDKEWSGPGYIVDIDPVLGVWRLQEYNYDFGAFNVVAYGGTEDWPWMTSWTSVLNEPDRFIVAHEIQASEAVELIAYNLSEDPRITTSSWCLKELVVPRTRLTRLEAGGNYLERLDVTECEWLTHVDVRANRLTQDKVAMDGAGIRYWDIYDGARYQNRRHVLLYLDLSSQLNGLSGHVFLGTGDARNSVLEYFNESNNLISQPLHIDGALVPETLDISFNSIPALTFSQGETRPSFWYLSNNALSGVDLGTIGVDTNWGGVEVFEAANNQLTELFFPPGTDWNRYYGWRPDDGYQLVRLDLSNNLLSALDVSNIDTLVYLKVSDNPLTSLDLPICEHIDFNISLTQIPSELVGWRGTFEASQFNTYYKHLSGVRELDISNTNVAELPAFVSIRKLKAHNCPSLTNIGGTATLTQFQTWLNPAGGSNISNSWFSVGTVGSRIASPVLDANAIPLTYSTKVLYFRNIGTGSGEEGNLSNSRPFLIGAPDRPGVNTSFNYCMARHPDALQRDFRFLEANPDLEQAEYWHGAVGFSATTEARMYDVDGFLGHLVELDVENCPSLTFVNLSGSAFLRKLRVVNCPQAEGRLLTHTNAEDQWRTYPMWLNYLELDATNWTTLRLDRNWAERPGAFDDYTRFIVRDTPVASPGISNFGINITKSRKGVNLRNIGLTDALHVPVIVQKISDYAYPNAEFGDSNVLDLRDNPFDKTNSTYVSLKNNLQGQSSAIVSMTNDGFNLITVVLATALRVANVPQTAVIEGVSPDRYNGAFALSQNGAVSHYPAYWVDNVTFKYRLRAAVEGEPPIAPAPVFAGATVFIGRGWTVLD